LLVSGSKHILNALHKDIFSLCSWLDQEHRKHNRSKHQNQLFKHFCNDL